MSRVRLVLFAAGTAVALAVGGVTGAMLYMSLAASAVPAAAGRVSVVGQQVFTRSAPLAPAATTPSPSPASHQGCPGHSGSSGSS